MRTSDPSARRPRFAESAFFDQFLLQSDSPTVISIWICRAPPTPFPVHLLPNFSTACPFVNVSAYDNGMPVQVCVASSHRHGISLRGQRSFVSVASLSLLPGSRVKCTTAQVPQPAARSETLFGVAPRPAELQVHPPSQTRTSSHTRTSRFHAAGFSTCARSARTMRSRSLIARAVRNTLR